MKIGILTFHRCINYGSYWQARCLAEAMQKRGVCETSSYRSLKVHDLMHSIGAEGPIIKENTGFDVYSSLLTEYLADDILHQLQDLRVSSGEWLENTLIHNTSYRYEFI